MKRVKYLLATLALALAATPALMAQEAKELPKVIQYIIEESDSTVIINVPDELLPDLEPSKTTPGTARPKTNVKPKETKKADDQPKRTVGRIDGFRIQIFGDGRNQSTLKARARARANTVLSRFGKYRGQISTFSSGPNMYTYVGNFTSKGEAQRALSELKRAFPQFAGEIRIVKAVITAK